jgi:heme oxygenase-like protein
VGSAKELFLYNRSVLDPASFARVVEIERECFAPRAQAFEAEASGMRSAGEVLSAMHDLLQREQDAPTDAASFLAARATRDEFKRVVGEFAVDGLTEAQSFFPILQRVPPKAQMALMRVFIDEFGCGNLEQSHSQLYRRLLAELDMPVGLESYVDAASEEVLAFVNLFYWLALRAPRPEYFLGALAYLEASVPVAFGCFADACLRLGVENHHYYTEHVHIDSFHSRELVTAIRALEAAEGIDGAKVWAGVRLGSTILDEAFTVAVERAKRGVTP